MISKAIQDTCDVGGDYDTVFYALTESELLLDELFRKYQLHQY